MFNDCRNSADGLMHRRQILGFASMLAGAGILGLMPGKALADDCAPFPGQPQVATIPEQAIQILADGNARFATEQSLNCDLLGEMTATAEKQTLFASVPACIDSHSAPELVFDQQIGDIFVACVARNLASTEVIGRFEYASQLAGAKAIVVRAHNHCGAVKGAVGKAQVGENQIAPLDEIEPAVAATPRESGRSSHNHHFVEALAETNVSIAVAALTEKSAVIKELVAADSVKVVGALYDIETGKITFLA